MTNFQIIKDINQIKLSQDWVEVPQLPEKIVEKDGRRYQVIEKERVLSFSERVGRCFLGTLNCIRSLDITLLVTPLWELFTGVKETARFGLRQKSVKDVTPQQQFEDIIDISEENISDNLPKTEHPIELSKTKELKLRAGISNYNASSCYLSATFQALAGLKDRTVITQSSCQTPTFFRRIFSLFQTLVGLKDRTVQVSELIKKVFALLDSGKTISVETTQRLVEEAYALKLTNFQPGVHGDPYVVLNNLLNNRASGLYTARRGNDYPLSYVTSIPSHKIPPGSSLQDIIDGKTEAQRPSVAKTIESAPSFFALNISSRCQDTGYDLRQVVTPHKLTVNSRDGQKVSYNLSSAVIFLGEKSTGANHYYTYERVDDSTWIKYNDSVVERIVDRDNRIQNLIEQRGYLLFYSKE